MVTTAKRKRRQEFFEESPLRWHSAALGHNPQMSQKSQGTKAGRGNTFLKSFQVEVFSFQRGQRGAEQEVLSLKH